MIIENVFKWMILYYLNTKSIFKKEIYSEKKWSQQEKTLNRMDFMQASHNMSIFMTYCAYDIEYDGIWVSIQFL